jgi:hypothetical protein
MLSPPLWRVPRLAAPWSWDEVPPLALVRAEDGAAPGQATGLRLGWDERCLHVRFDCRDRDAWGTYRRRDEPLYEEEVVEVFLAPGAEDPVRYVELEVSPLGTLFDAVLRNPTGLRRDLTAETAWDCPGLAWEVGRLGPRQDWWAALAIPWRALEEVFPPAAPTGPAPPPLWRANFYRIERPRDGAAEFSAASPTFARPADFHRPERFGTLELAGAGAVPGRIR